MKLIVTYHGDDDAHDYISKLEVFCKSRITNHHIWKDITFNLVSVEAEEVINAITETLSNNAYSDTEKIAILKERFEQQQTAQFNSETHRCELYCPASLPSKIYIELGAVPCTTVKERECYDVVPIKVHLNEPTSAQSFLKCSYITDGSIYRIISQKGRL